MNYCKQCGHALSDHTHVGNLADSRCTVCRCPFFIAQTILPPFIPTYTSRAVLRARRRANLRAALSGLALVVSACMAVGAIYGFILLFIAAYDAVTGH